MAPCFNRKQRRVEEWEMTELDINIGKRLQTARKALGFKSARSFARKHGIPESTYSQHETGKRALNPSTMLTYCGRLNIEPSWLVTGTANTAAPVSHTLTNMPLLRSILKKELSHLISPHLRDGIDGVLNRSFNIHQATIAKQAQKAEAEELEPVT